MPKIRVAYTKSYAKNYDEVFRQKCKASVSNKAGQQVVSSRVGGEAGNVEGSAEPISEDSVRRHK